MTGLWLFLGLAVVGWVAGMPRRKLALAGLGLWSAILLAHLAAPDRATRWVGGDLHLWLLAGGIVALVSAYRALLRYLRTRAVPLPDAAPKPEPEPADGLSDAEIDRYARHLVLRDLGGPGQERLRQARVLIVGAGGLGTPVSLYLAAAGVGRITIADDDQVSLSNLQRQVMFRTDQCGQDKTRAAQQALNALNPLVRVTTAGRISDNDMALIAGHDLVLDGTDNFATRAMVNLLCVRAGVPLIAGAIAQWDGQVTLYDPARGGPCMACMFPTAPAPGTVAPCAEAGVVGPLPGIVGSMMALEAIKHLTGAGQGLRSRMVIFDGLYGESRMIATAARPDCPVCQKPHLGTGI